MKARADESPGVVVAIDGEWLHIVIAKGDVGPCFRANWASRFVRYTKDGDSVYRCLKNEARRAAE